MNEQRHAVLQSDALLGDDERALRQVVTAFADEVIAPASYEANRTRTLPIGIVRQMGELGLFGLPFPEAVGGQGGHQAAGGIGGTSTFGPGGASGASNGGGDGGD